MREQIVIEPQEGPQSDFVHSEADITIFGGAAGGGKTYGLLLVPLPYLDCSDVSCTIFRRTSPEVFNQGGPWDESEKLYSILGAKANLQDKEWTFPDGLRVRFAHLQHEKNIYDWKGAQIPIIGFDELTGFTEAQFWYMLSRNRSAASSIRPFIRATTNADADSWVAKLVEWWVDEQGFAIPERSGKWRWFIRIGDVIIWGDTAEEIKQAYPDTTPLSITFIHSSLEDNPLLSKKDPAYKSRILAMPEVERERLLGNWKIKPSGNRFFPPPTYAKWPGGQALAYVDPAFGGGNNTALCISVKNEERYCLRGMSWPKHVSDCYQDILLACRRWDVATLYVESNKDEGASARDLARMRGGGVEEYRERENKHMRISRFVYNYWNFIDFAEDAENDPVFMKNFINYEQLKEPDDEADAGAGAMRQHVSPNPRPQFIKAR